MKANRSKPYVPTVDIRDLTDGQFREAMEAFWRPWGHKDGLGPCQQCMLRPAVTFHHIEPRSLAPEKVRDPWNLIPLCNQCHERMVAGKTGRSELRTKVTDRAKAILEWNGDDSILWETENGPEN